MAVNPANPRHVKSPVKEAADEKRINRNRERDESDTLYMLRQKAREKEARERKVFDELWNKVHGKQK